ncbi:hypothetical protein BKA67DRAFT_218580 [Truncatella angustata]|uniref:Uncharacterized protein n=1 Tax=Truncatella angustata TaxID=152316 RepID=A0A9P8UV85_9PEZI|nr:uncharacterized protein BKA67DRAFT_218580 [Truncatella angustata]KAH6658635.1 hypothetical protein BKA67DRAFT_218580 [Truncatella angustata]
MAEVETPTGDASDALCNYGFFGIQDASVGDRVQEKQSKGFPCLSEEGLEFLYLNFLSDQGPIKTFLPKCAVGRYREFRSDRDHIFQFRKGGESKAKVFVSLLWKPGSEVVFYGRSHLHTLASVIASNGLFEVPLAALEAAGCSEGTLLRFENGGM